MGVGGISSSNSMSFMQMPAAGTPDVKSKKIQDEITDIEREMQKISSNAELSYTEKTDERKTLQKEISNLNTKLDQRQEELLRSQKRESMLTELREERKPEKEDDTEDALLAKGATSDTTEETNAIAPADESQAQPQGAVIASTDDGTVILKGDTRTNETPGSVSEKEQTAETEEEDKEEKTKTADSDTDTSVRPSSEEMRAMVSADTSAQLANRQGTIVTKTEDGIAILKGEIAQDERRGVDTEGKQAELEKMRKQEIRAMDFQFSELDKAMNAMESANGTNVVGIEKTAQDEQTMQRQFQVSIA